MTNLWSDTDAREYVSRYDNGRIENDILLQGYATALLGADPDLTMHGGGNTSVKTTFVDGAGTAKRALYVKASGTPLNLFIPEYFVTMDLGYLESFLRSRGDIDDETMAREFKAHRLSGGDKLPSIESLMHASIPARIVDHTHPAAILKIVNRVGGSKLFKECFHDELAVIPHTRMGYDLAAAVSAAARDNAGCEGVVMRHHGLVVWGEGVREVYDKTIDIVNRAEEFLTALKSKEVTAHNAYNVSVVLLNTDDVMELINSAEGKGIICDPPLAPDYPMLDRIRLRWVDGDTDAIPVPAPDEFPIAVVRPKIGVMCYGADKQSAQRTADFVYQALSIRRAIFETGGTYESIAEEFIQDMQYRGYQQAKKPVT